MDARMILSSDALSVASPVSSSDAISSSGYGLMRKAEVLRLLQISKATLHRRIRSNAFPAPLKISERIVAWPRAEVFAWIAKRERA